MFSFILDLPIWQLIRSLGIVSYLMLTAGVIFGILYGFPGMKAASKKKIYKIHSFSTVGGTAVGMLHGILTVIDPYMPFSWSEILIPFTAQHNPVLNGIGTLIVFGMLIVILTTDLRNKLGKKLWLAIHMAAYPLFIMSFIHGFFLGTDSKLLVVRWMYILSMLAVLGLTTLRGFVRGNPHTTDGIHKTQSAPTR